MYLANKPEVIKSKDKDACNRNQVSFVEVLRRKIVINNWEKGADFHLGKPSFESYENIS